MQKTVCGWRSCTGRSIVFASLTLPLALAAAAEELIKVMYPQVSEVACPLQVVSIPGRDGDEVTAVVRQPPGSGPFPAIVLLHGGLSPYSLQTLRQEALTRPNY